MFAPFGSPATNLSATWHREPRGRGTFNVLSTCLTTMILCVWTAVHLNIPDHNGGTRQRFLHKLGWLLLALLAPEIVAWNAWEQRQTAQELTRAFVETFESANPPPPGWIRRAWHATKQHLPGLRVWINAHSWGPAADCIMKESHPDPEQGSKSNSRAKITSVHGFYAAMGGFAIQSHTLDKQHPSIGQGRLTLTREGILLVLRMAPQMFPDLSEAEILDKSKASTLVKTLTCLQAFWFCVQCIMRLTMNSSITLLELNVFGHCVCTFAIYAIWWNKPMDISEPTLLKLEERPDAQGLIALLCSYTSRTVPRLPHPLAECVVHGHEYRRKADSVDTHTADNYNAIFAQHSRRNRYTGMSADEYWRLDREFDAQLYEGNLRTQFETPDSPVSSPFAFRDRGPIVYKDEKQVEECAGLRIERLEQLLDIGDRNPQM